MHLTEVKSCEKKKIVDLFVFIVHLKSIRSEMCLSVKCNKGNSWIDLLLIHCETIWWGFFFDSWTLIYW